MSDVGIGDLTGAIVTLVLGIAIIAFLVGALPFRPIANRSFVALALDAAKLVGVALLMRWYVLNPSTKARDVVVAAVGSAIVGYVLWRHLRLGRLLTIALSLIAVVGTAGLLFASLLFD